MATTRYMMGTGLVVGAGVLTVTALVYPAMKGVQNVASSAVAQTVTTPSGPLTPDDRTFVVKVRLAGLWEFPAGQMAVQKGTTAAVKTAGEHLIQGHTNLDTSVRAIAPQLGVTLPNQPTLQQQGFLATLSAATGADFDSKFANILRLTHGQIFTAIAKIRTTTKNSLVRELADQANTTVLDHITVMEKTGLVNFDQLVNQETASPTIDPNQTAAPSPSPGAPVVIVTPSADASLPPAATSPTPQVK